MNFRYDINGLRAIAVIAVVLFHFNPEWVPGGFAGVDVFFVISGFLMTGIIFRGLENNDFNLFKFYIARANRIIPALVALCLVLLVYGWFYLIPLDYKALGKHVASSIGFLSNIIYWRESGYFDAVSHEKWLLHTWSLSVEWQFYIIYPIILLALQRFLSLEYLKRLVVIGTLIGFFFSVIATMKWTNPAYYLLPTRAWEMMAGGVAFLYPWNISGSKKKLAEILGLLLILASYIFISSEVPWPGHFALVPVLGAYLIIVANHQSSFITNNSVFQYLGKWSYSIYLWHWPIVVLLYIEDLNSMWIFGVISSVIFGFISYKFIESNKLIKVNGTIDLLKLKYTYYLLLSASFSLLVYINNGLDIRSINEEYSYQLEKDRLVPNLGLSGSCEGKFNLSQDCRTSDEPKILVWGDSFAMHLVPGIIASNPKASIIQMTKSTCGPFFGVSPNRKDNSFSDGCLEFNDEVKNWIKKNHTSIEYVVMSSPFSYHYGSGRSVILSNHEVVIFNQEDVDKYFRSGLDFIKSLNITPVIVTPPPATGNDFGKCLSKNNFKGISLNQCDFQFKDISEDQKKIYSWLDTLKQDYNLIKLEEFLCKKNTCMTSFNGKYIYRDSGHLSYEGAKYLGQELDLYSLITNKR
ncbi:acyltransferase family protein [Vibrio sp. EJY3]|uniref:acyltransferase family protein n=1 Tax=Vibrio sp. (strain EJY3) TaxID=1116375 RepID=UPI000243B1D9|nr:acyltransferase family protein [Vibrio sp. EJY3]AEX22416.1 acyltransferase [Vibrio sp. EJY3]